MRIAIQLPRDLDLSRLTAEMETAINQTLQGAVMLIANDAKRSVASGPKTGFIYTSRYKTNTITGRIFPSEQRSVAHQASAPGEAPATDTGKLVGSIVAGAAKLNGFVEVRSVYGRWLEYGTRDTPTRRGIAARPFLVPAVERNRARITAMLQAAIQTGAGRFARKPGR